MLASILFWLIIVHYVMMVIAPLLQTVSGEQTPKMGRRALSAWFGMLCGALLCSYWLEYMGGKEPFLPTMQAQTVYAYGSWATFFGGLGIVVWSFIKASRLRKQQRITVTN